jgi:hypothetical protein
LSHSQKAIRLPLAFLKSHRRKAASPMIPLIGILLCIYLVFKGFEIFQMAYVTKDAPRGSIVLGIVAILSSIGIGGFFALMFLMSDPSIRSLMQ